MAELIFGSVLYSLIGLVLFMANAKFTDKPIFFYSKLFFAGPIVWVISIYAYIDEIRNDF